VRLTQPTALNDPFELLPELCVPANAPEKAIALSFDIMAKRRLPLVGEVDDNTKTFNCSDIVSRYTVTELNYSIGIFCLSRNEDSLLMWSHYAQQYAGAVIEFDGYNPFFEGQLDIEYQATRPRKDISSYLPDPIAIAELCVKAKEWEYESEVRIIRPLAECDNIGKKCPRGFPIYTKKMPEECMREIVLGERVCLDDARQIWERVKATKISLSLAAISNWGYTFGTEKIKVDVPSPAMKQILTPRTAHIFSHLPGELGAIARLLIEKHPMSKFVNKPV
jgi:hypothetical protein